jgi:hypothetical protein
LVVLENCSYNSLFWIDRDQPGPPIEDGGWSERGGLAIPEGKGEWHGQSRCSCVHSHETTDNQVQPLPFVGESQEGESFEELSCFTPEQPISGNDKRSEVPALFKTGLQVLLLLLALLSGQDLLVGVSGPIQLGVRISHADVNTDICPTCPEASNEEISPLFVAWAG